MPVIDSSVSVRDFTLSLTSAVPGVCSAPKVKPFPAEAQLASLKLYSKNIEPKN